MGFCTAATAGSPAAGTDAVLSLHAQGSGELQLQYARDIDGKEPQTVSVALGKDYHAVTDQNGLLLYDYQLRRVYNVDPAGRFTNNSLYAAAWFRVAQMDVRVRLRKTLQAGEQDPFWMESDLGIVSPELPRPDVQRSELEGRTRWMVGTTQVAAVRYDPAPVPDAIRGELRRFWGTFVQLHPAIADDLTASARMPEELWIMAQHPGKDPTVTHWKLKSRQWRAAAPLPLPPHLTASPTAAEGAFPEIFALLSKEVAERTMPPAQDVYASRAQAAIDRGAGLEAMLTVIEMNLAQGHPAGSCAPGDPRVFCALAVKADPLVKSDPRYALAFARQSPDAADRAQFAGLPNAYVLGLQWATRPAGKGVARENSERDLLAALKASPVADFTKDTGDFYAMGFEPLAAWQVWDLGRLLAGHVPDDLLHTIDSLEDQLYVGVPSLF